MTFTDLWFNTIHIVSHSICQTPEKGNSTSRLLELDSRLPLTAQTDTYTHISPLELLDVEASEVGRDDRTVFSLCLLIRDSPRP